MIKGRKGSVIIFVMMFFLSLLTLIFAFINNAKDIAVKSTVESLMPLWSTSILGEYDINLQERYNIFGFYGDEKEVKRKIEMYGEYSFKDKKYVRYEGCSTNLYDYSLINLEAFKGQVTEVGKLLAVEQLILPSKGVSSHKEPNISLKNEQILSNLPSSGWDKEFSLSQISNALENAREIEEVIDSTSKLYLENCYIKSYFKDGSNSKNLGETFFSKEIEYIICGKSSDEANASSIKTRIVGLRELINFAFALKDPKMNAEALAAAEIITPGPGSLLTQKGLLAAWALAESYNDYALLINGEKVPLVKTEVSWATDLSSIIDGNEGGYINPHNERGERYEDYLNLFLYSMDEDLKLLRVMDLIQINMKYLYYSDFKIKDYYGGIEFTLKVNGEEFHAVKEY